jgi:alkanesulfonate monooxygenase SsuD/methylene tetrahydromethanopterin reductase-like flavin-dependent oxidoreductase (luciferase family)
MQFGATFPTTEIGDDPVAVRDFAQAAEALGYSHIVAYDHVLGAVHAGREPKLWGPYTENDPFHEPFVLFGFLAGVTTTIEFETAIIILPQRQTVLVAKQAAEVDVLTGGRLRRGGGTGRGSCPGRGGRSRCGSAARRTWRCGGPPGSATASRSPARAVRPSPRSSSCAGCWRRRVAIPQRSPSSSR